MNSVKKLLKSKAFLAFAAGALLYILLSVPEMIRYGGFVMYTSDYAYMALPNFLHSHDAILSGNVNWDWIAGNGSQFLGSYIAQQLSPFYILNLITPKSLLLYVLPYITALKFGTGSLFAFIYIRRFVKNEHLAVVGGILYIFSSYTAYTLIFNFIDVILLFPLLLYSLDELCINGRRGLFAITVALMGFHSIYLLLSQAVFCVIYYFIRCTDKDFKANLKQFFTLAFEAVLGVCISLVIALPYVLYLLEMPRTTNVISPSGMFMYHDIFHYLKIFQGGFMIPDPIYYTSLFPETEDIYPFGTKFACAAAYIPLFGASGVISWIWARRKTWQSKLFLVCTVIAFVPVLNSVFSALNTAYYARWFYMPMFIGIIVSLKALDEKISFKPGLIINGSILAAFFIYLLFFRPYGFALARGTTYTPRELICINDLLNQYGSFAIWQILIPVFFLIVLYFISKAERGKKFNAAIYIASFSAVAVGFNLYTYYYSTIFLGSGDMELTAELYKELTTAENIYKDDRISTEYANDLHNVFYVNETQDVQRNWNISDIGYIDFLKSAGYDSIRIFSQFNLYECSAPADIMSVKYFVSYEVPVREYFEAYGRPVYEEINYYKYLEEYGNDDDYEPAKISFEDVCNIGEPFEAFGKIYFQENPNYISMGFTYDKMISKEKYDELDTEFETYNELRRKYRLPLKAIVVEDPSLFSDILTLADDEVYDHITDEEYQQIIEKRRSECCDYVDKTTEGLTAKITLSKENLVFFSVSWNEHWTAYVDGEKTDYYNVNNGMIGVRVPAGTHEIKLVYTTPGVLAGGIISAVSTAVLIIYLVIAKKSRKTENSADLSDNCGE